MQERREFPDRFCLRVGPTLGGNLSCDVRESASRRIECIRGQRTRVGACRFTDRAFDPLEEIRHRWEIGQSGKTP